MDKSSNNPLGHQIESKRQARELKNLWDKMNLQERDMANKIFASLKFNLNKVIDKAKEGGKDVRHHYCHQSK